MIKFPLISPPVSETSHHQHHHSYSQQHHHRSYTLSHPSSSSPTIVQQPTHHYPENPCPRYRLNFDDGEANSTTSNDSAGVSGQEHEGTPPGPFRSVVASGSSLRHETTMGPAGDWSQELENEFSDSDDEVFCRRGTMTAPPRLPVRSAYRSRGMRKPPPRLNLHLLDSPENEPQPKNRREKTPSPHRKMNGVATPARRKSRTSFQQRLISHEDSADEP